MRSFIKCLFLPQLIQREPTPCSPLTRIMKSCFTCPLCCPIRQTTSSRYDHFKDRAPSHASSFNKPSSSSPTVFSSQLLRKRHIGNDIVTIVFQEPGALPFTPKNIRSHFQHVFVVVRAHSPCSESSSYR